MPLSYPADDISLNDLRRDIAGYSWSFFRQDMLSGLSVALIALPQAMAYALLAGLPLSCGLFAAIYSAIIAALFGSSRHLIVGPSNAIALLIQSGTAEILYTYYRDLTPIERDIVAIQILTQLTLLTALLQIIAAWLKLGRLTQFVSHSVVIGYVIGAAMAVIINQLFIFLGIHRLTGVHSLYEHAVNLISNLNHLQWPTALIGMGSMALLFTLKRLNKNIPIGVITFIVAGLIVEGLGISSYSGSSLFSTLFLEEDWIPNVMVVGDTGEFYDMIPQISFPFFNMRIMNGLLPVAFAIALLSIMETTSISKSLAANSGQRISSNQEVFGIGLGNLLSSFIGAMPVSGSPARSGVNYQSGAQTRFSAIFSAIFIGLLIFLFGFLVTRIPLASMAALLLVTAMSIVNSKQFLICLRATSADAFVLWTTLLACIFFSLDVAFYVGVALSIILYLQKAAVPQLVEYDIDDSGELKNLDPHAEPVQKEIRLIKVEGELFFGAADLLQSALKRMMEGDNYTRIIILQLKNARDIDATACFAIQQLHDYLRNSNKHLVACGLTPHIWEVLNNSGLVDQIGHENLFVFDEKYPQKHMQQAIQWSKTLISSRTDNSEEPVPVLDPVPEQA